MAYEVVLNFAITQDGKPFSSGKELRYDNLSYDDVVQLQEVGLQAYTSLISLAKENAKKKAAEAPK